MSKSLLLGLDLYKNNLFFNNLSSVRALPKYHVYYFQENYILLKILSLSFIYRKK